MPPSNRLWSTVIGALLLLPLTATPSSRGEVGGDRTEYRIHSCVVGVAGARGASPAYRLAGTAGQATPIGIGASEAFRLYAGFWQRLMALYADTDPAAPPVLRTTFYGAHPNPCHGAAVIRYATATAGPVALTIFDLSGRRVRMLHNAHASPGEHQFVWDGRDDRGAPVPAGVYFHRLAVGSFESVKRLLVLR